MISTEKEKALKSKPTKYTPTAAGGAHPPEENKV